MNNDAFIEPQTSYNRFLKGGLTAAMKKGLFIAIIAFALATGVLLYNAWKITMLNSKENQYDVAVTGHVVTKGVSFIDKTTGLESSKPVTEFVEVNYDFDGQVLSCEFEKSKNPSEYNAASKIFTQDYLRPNRDTFTEKIVTVLMDLNNQSNVTLKEAIKYEKNICIIAAIFFGMLAVFCLYGISLGYRVTLQQCKARKVAKMK